MVKQLFIEGESWFVWKDREVTQTAEVNSK